MIRSAFPALEQGEDMEQPIVDNQVKAFDDSRRPYTAKDLEEPQCTARRIMARAVWNIITSGDPDGIGKSKTHPWR